jgi:hypothetical protein
MVEDLERLGVNFCVWAALGGSSIAPPVLEEEAFGTPGIRELIHGAMNDSEFIRLSRARGIEIAAVIFASQLWEVAIETNAEETQLLSMNFRRGAGTPGRFGAREFSQNRYPQLFPAFEQYFPDRLASVNDGVPVDDLLDLVVARDFNGHYVHTAWVEAPDISSECYIPCRNQPAYLAYLKKMVDIQLAAGARAIVLDETDGAFTNGGCYCPRCMRGFRDYLQQRAAGALPAALQGVQWATFDYHQYLCEQRVTAEMPVAEIPLFRDFMAYELGLTGAFYQSLRTHIEAQGTPEEPVVAVAACFELLPYMAPLLRNTQCLVGELLASMRESRVGISRLGRGFVAARQGQFVSISAPDQDLLDMMATGTGFPLLQVRLAESAAFGASFSLPYGGWLGTGHRDALYLDPAPIAPLQQFITEHATLLTGDLHAPLALLMSVRNLQWGCTSRTGFDGAESPWQRFRALAEALGALNLPFDALVHCDLPDDVDALRINQLLPYAVVVLPEISALDDATSQVLMCYLEGGGQVLAVGGAPLATLEQCAGFQRLAHWRDVTMDVPLLAAASPFTLTGGEHVVVAPNWVSDDEVAYMLVNQAYDDTRDAIRPTGPLCLSTTLPWTPDSMVWLVPGQPPLPLSAGVQEGKLIVRIPSLGVTGILRVRRG